MSHPFDLPASVKVVPPENPHYHPTRVSLAKAREIVAECRERQEWDSQDRFFVEPVRGGAYVIVEWAGSPAGRIEI